MNLSRVRRAAAASGVAVLLSVGLAAPARAGTISGGNCAVFFDGAIYRLREGTVHYTLYSNGQKYVYDITWYLSTTGDSGRTSNNVNIGAWDNGVPVWSRYSPDNLRYGWGSARSWTNVGFWLRGETKTVLLEAIFDVNDQPDPRCHALLEFS